MNKLPDYDRAWVPADSSIEPFCEAWCGRTEPKAEGGFPIHDREWLFQCLQRDIALANSCSPLIESSRDHHQIILVYCHPGLQVGGFHALRSNRT